LAVPPQPSILQKIFGWLKGKPEVVAEPVKVKPREARRPQREGPRRERDRRGGGREETPTGQRRGPEGGRDHRRGQQRLGEDERRPNKPPSAQTSGRGSEPARAEGTGEVRARAPERPERSPRSERPERTERPERPRTEGGPEQHAEGRGRRRRGRRERGFGGAEAESPRAAYTESGAERVREQDQPRVASSREDADVSGTDVTTASWSEPAARTPDNREHVFESTGGESVREPVIAEHLVQSGVREPQTERDREPAFVAATINIASSVAQAEPDVAPVALRETGQQEAPASRVPHFELPPDLVQVETSPGRAQQAQADPTSAEERFEGRGRRTTPPEEPVPSEPLVQVETRH
jgi:hypothetical protein